MRRWLLWGFDDGPLWCCELLPSLYWQQFRTWRWTRRDGRRGRSKIVDAINAAHARTLWALG